MIKRFRERFKEKRLMRFSITIKWTLLTSLFIFVLFSIFAFVTYQTTTTLMVKQERENLDRTLTEIQSRLENSATDLTIRNSILLLKETSPLSNSIYKDKETIEGSLIRLNSFISELSQPELSVFVYNTEDKMVFETKSGAIPFTPTKNRQITIKSINNTSGFVATTPVYSKKTNELIGYVQLFYELTAFYQLRSRLLLTVAILEVAGVFMSVILGYLLARFFMRPMQKMMETIDEIKVEPQSEIRMPVLASQDELADLSEAFNEMLDRMQKFIEQQQQFVEDVSHELRTPVAIIEGHLKLLNRWGKDDPVVLDESLQASLQEIVRMKSLVQEMLDLSRVEQVEFQYRNEKSNAQEVILQTYNNFKLLYEDFDFILDDDLTHDINVNMYRNHFEQLLIILLDNAVKYSTDRQEIHLSASTTNNQLELAIQDYGEGISEEDLEKVFYRFYRVDKARSRHKGGNGLGLSIAQQIVENYQGKINVESSLGKGTIFRIKLPITK